MSLQLNRCSTDSKLDVHQCTCDGGKATEPKIAACWLVAASEGAVPSSMILDNIKYPQYAVAESTSLDATPRMKRDVATPVPEPNTRSACGCPSKNFPCGCLVFEKTAPMYDTKTWFCDNCGDFFSSADHSEDTHTTETCYRNPKKY